MEGSPGGKRLRVPSLARSLSKSISMASQKLEDFGFHGSTAHSRTTRQSKEDEEALKWAAIEKLSTYDRLRTSIMETFVASNGNLRQGVVHKEVDVTKLDMNDRQQFIKRMFKVAEEDKEKYLKRFRNRIDK